MLVSGGADWTLRCWDVKSPGGPPNQRPAVNGTLANGAAKEREEESLATFVCIL
jgi:transcription initiation factor TFIID subunit 5